MLHERGDADDGVVSPVMRFAQLPEMQAGREYRTVRGTGKLLHPRKQRIATCGARHGLDDSGARIALRNQHEPGQTLPRHYAVRIENHHVAIVATPTTAKVRDVAALALDAVLAPTIEDASESIHRAAQLRPRR